MGRAARHARRSGVLLACVGMLALGAAGAWAQPGYQPIGGGANPGTAELEYGRRKDRLAIGATFGFNGFWTTERFAPVRVFLGGSDVPMSGVIEIEYRQDATQDTVQRVPFATTPNAVTEVEVIVCPSTYTQTVEITALSESGRRLGGRRFEQMRGPVGSQLPYSEAEQGPFVVSMTETMFRHAPQGLSKRQAPTTDDNMYYYGGVSDPWRNIRQTRIDPEDVPRTWVGLDGVSVLIARSGQASNLSRDALEAVVNWVHAGGSLVLIDELGGADLSLWSGLDLTSAITPLIRQSMDAPKAEIDEMVGRYLASLRGAGDQDSDEDENQNDPDESDADESKLQSRDTLSARLFRCTDQGIADGWSTRFVTDDSTGTGILAEGPVGLGWVVVVGVEPEQLVIGPASEVAATVWWDLLGYLDERDWSAQHNGSGATGNQASALSKAVSSTLSVRAVGVSAIVFVLAAGLVLVLLVGPVDAIVLHRLRLSHRSWATAMGWILLMSLGAYFYPTLIRAGNSSVSRYDAIDARYDETGRVVSASRSGVTGFFAATSGPVTYSEPTPGTWLRGFASLHTYGATSLPTLFVDQLRLAEDGFSGRTGWPGLASSNPGTAGRASAQRMWTLRTVLDQGPPADAVFPNLSIELEDDEDDALLRIGGLPTGQAGADGDDRDPSGLKEFSVALFMRDGCYMLESWQSVERLAEPIRLWRRSSAPRNWDADVTENNYYPYWSARRMSEFTAAQFLPGAERRGVAINKLLKSGTHAVVMIACRHEGPLTPSGFSTDKPGDESRITVFRIVVPVGVVTHSESAHQDGAQEDSE